jgi:outer membrane protein
MCFLFDSFRVKLTISGSKLLGVLFALFWVRYLRRFTVKVKHIACFVLALLLIAGSTWADEIVSFKAGYISLNPDGIFAVNSGGIPGTKVDFDDDLNYDDSEELFAEIALNLGNFRLAAGYLPIDFSGEGNLNQTLIFNGRSFLVNSKVSSSVDMDIYDLGLTWNILNIDDLPVRVQLGPELSVKVVDANVSMVDHTTGLSESDSLTAPVPTIGARAKVGLSDWVALVGRVGYMEYDGNSFLDVDGQIEFSPIPLVGIFAGYRYLDLDIDESGLFIDATLDGPYAGVFARF